MNSNKSTSDQIESTFMCHSTGPAARGLYALHLGLKKVLSCERTTGLVQLGPVKLSPEHGEKLIACQLGHAGQALPLCVHVLHPPGLILAPQHLSCSRLQYLREPRNKSAISSAELLRLNDTWPRLLWSLEHPLDPFKTRNPRDKTHWPRYASASHQPKTRPEDSKMFWFPCRTKPLHSVHIKRFRTFWDMPVVDPLFTVLLEALERIAFFTI